MDMDRRGFLALGGGMFFCTQRAAKEMVKQGSGGRIVKEGGKELALELEEKGYVEIDSETRQVTPA